MGTDASRIEIQEGAYPLRARRLDGALTEIMAGLTCSNSFTTITRTLELISKIEYFTDAGRTTLDHEVIYTRGAGSDGVEYITGIVAIYYEWDGTTEDSRVTVTIIRDGSDLITSCDAVFSTSESEKL